MKLSPARKAIIALIIANIIWGAGGPIFKLALHSIPPFTLAFWRFYLSAALMRLIFGSRAVIPGRLFRKDWRNLLLYTIYGITVNMIFYFWGIKLTLSLNAPIIASAAPIMTMAVAFLYLREHFRPKKILGVLTGSCGIALIVLEPLAITGNIGGSVLGNLFLIIATAGAVGQTVIGHSFIKHYDPLKITFWSNAIGSFTFLPFAVWELVKAPDLYSRIALPGYFGIFWGTVFSSFIAYYLFAWGISKMTATDASLFNYIDPIVGTFLSAIMLQEIISPLFLLGTVFIFGGIFIAEGRFHYHPLSRLLKKELNELANLTPINQH
jgi:drug/metabolite transporter (DMT)-like permease